MKRRTMTRILPALKTLGVVALGCLMMSIVLLWRQGIWAILATAAIATAVSTAFTTLAAYIIGLKVQDKQVSPKPEITDEMIAELREKTKLIQAELAKTQDSLVRLLDQTRATNNEALLAELNKQHEVVASTRERLSQAKHRFDKYTASRSVQGPTERGGDGE